MKIIKQSVSADIAKDKFDACFSVLTSEHRVVVKATHRFANSALGLAAFSNWVRKWEDAQVELVVIMEATGVYYEALAWALHQQGRKVAVVLANRAKKYFQSLGYKSKNDRLDARALAHMGAERSLEPWQPLSRQLYLLRKLTREHEQLQQVRTETANRLHAESYGMHVGKSTVKRLEKTLQLYDAQLQAIRQEIKATVEKDALLQEKISKVTTIKGVGLLTAATIAAETNGFALFPANLNPDGVQVIFYDQLGSHYSDQPDDPSLWSMERFVDELHQVVQALDLENQFVFANSWGAVLLIEYLFKYEASFRGIILSGMPPSFRKFKQNIAELRARLPQDVRKQLEVHERNGTTASPEYQQLLFEHWFNRHYCVLKPWPEPLMQALQHLSVSVLVSLLGADVFNFEGPAASWDRSSDLGKITTPALLIAGKEDLMFEEDLKFMAEQMPRAEYFLSPTGGHFCWWAGEDVFFGRLTQFIEEHR